MRKNVETGERVLLKQWREDRGLSKYAVSRLLNVDAAYYLKFERGDIGEPIYSTMKGVMDLTGMTFEEIQTRKGENDGTDIEERKYA